MNHRKQLVLVVALVVVVGLVPSSDGVSSAQVDRGFDVDVVDDSSAYLGYNQTLSNTTNETTDIFVTVKNQFPSETALTTVCVSVDGEAVALTENDSLAPGEQATAEFDSVSCGSTVTVNASGNLVSVRLERSVNCR